MQHLIATARNHRLAFDQTELEFEPEIELVLTLHDRELAFVGAGLVNVDQVNTVRIGISPDAARRLSASLTKWADEADDLADRTKFNNDGLAK